MANRPRPCACGHVHGGRAYGLCLVEGCDCVEVKSPRRKRRRR